MTDLRAIISDHWSALQRSAPGATWMTSALPVEVGGASVLCAIGPDGGRHMLVPASAGRAVRPDRRSAAVQLMPLALEERHEIRQYADLVLLRDDLADVFTGLCADVMVALALGDRNPLLVVAKVLDEWRELFRGGSQMGIEALAGLFAEMVFLNELLDIDNGLLSAWQGPLRASQDFSSRGRAVEVKATATGDGRTVRIHGIEQLVGPPGGLLLRWMRLDTSSSGGISLPELVESTVERVSRPREVWDLLARAGYLTADRAKYGGLRFTVVETASYEVTDAFPRIVPTSLVGELPAGLSDVRYTVDLNLASPPLQQSEVDNFLNAMAGR